MSQNKVIYFLDHELSPDEITIVQNDTNTSLFIDFTCFVPWKY